MFLRKHWLPISVFVVLIVGIGLYHLQTQSPKDPIIIYKPVEPLPKSTQRTVDSETQPDVAPFEVQPENPADIETTDAAEEATIKMTRSELRELIKMEVDKRAPALIDAEKAKLLEIKEAELAAAAALDDLNVWVQKFRVDFKAELAEIREADLDTMSEKEQLALFEKMLGVDGKLNEVFDRVAALPKLARDRVLESIEERFSNPDNAEYVLAEIQSRIVD